MSTLEVLETIVQNLKDEIEELKERMKVYETEARVNNLLLHGVKQQVDSLHAIGKWILGIVAGLLVSVLGGLILYLLIGR